MSDLKNPGAQATEWIVQHVLPLWLQKGFDSKTGNFVEALSPQGQPLPHDRRAMVQARQIYSYRLALDMDWLSPDHKVIAQQQILRSAGSLLTDYSLASGAFLRSITVEGLPSDRTLDLYTQAFALFGLANAYRVEKNPKFPARALDLVGYLKRERQLSQGGFSELQSGQIVFEANPHMHLFEAALAWMEVDLDPTWVELAHSILTLCLERFIDSETGCLAEHFDANWKPLRERQRFVVEPGHQYEWAWLLQKYENLQRKPSLAPVREKLFRLSEKHGINPQTQAVYDEVWSDGSVKTATSRFWPQCERIKCASGIPSQEKAAMQSMKTLLRYFQTPLQGLWADRMDEAGQLIPEVSKASSLYHIAGAISELNLLSN